MTKGQSSFLIKALSIVIASIAFVLVVIYFTSFMKSTVEEKEISNFKIGVMGILQKLVTDEECLAYVHSQTPQKSVIDIGKLKSFVSDYKDVEPACAKALGFDYNVRVTQFEKNFTLYPGEPIKERVGAGAVFNRLLKLIDGKRVVFVLDTSGSMMRDGGDCDVDLNYPNTKICCLKQFMYGFIDQMNDKSVISVIPYGTNEDGRTCKPNLLFPFTELDGSAIRNDLKSKIATFSPQDGTPMCRALEEGFIYADTNNAEVIVLLTDGCENVCCNPPTTDSIADKYKDTKIPVYTVAYGTQACPPPLQKTAEITDGEYFDARVCEELIGRPPSNKTDIVIPFERWGFGVTSFSPDKAREFELQLSLPITIKYNESYSAEGIIYIYAVKGELEELYSLIEDMCEKARMATSDITFTRQFYFSQPVKYSTSAQKLCMGSFCKTFESPYELQFDNIEIEGDYVLEFSFIKEINRIVVMK